MLLRLGMQGGGDSTFCTSALSNHRSCLHLCVFAACLEQEFFEQVENGGGTSA